ncbi:MAG: hypothetical protein OHK0046_17070 [Anaerolineae bacterium]
MNDNRYLHLIRQDCPLPPGTHVVVYCRDSGGDEQDRSITQQIDVAREYCQHHNLVLDKLYVDESKLSSNTDKRDALQEMLFDLRRRFKHINEHYKCEKASRENPFGVIFWKSNRLGCDNIEATNIKTDLRLRGITIVDLVTWAILFFPQNFSVKCLLEAISQCHIFRIFELRNKLFKMLSKPTNHIMWIYRPLFCSNICKNCRVIDM